MFIPTGAEQGEHAPLHQITISPQMHQGAGYKLHGLAIGQMFQLYIPKEMTPIVKAVAPWARGTKVRTCMFPLWQYCGSAHHK